MQHFQIADIFQGVACDGKGVGGEGGNWSRHMSTSKSVLDLDKEG